MREQASLTLGSLVHRHGLAVLTTWTLLTIEVALLALIPLFLGNTIDALLIELKIAALTDLASLLFALILAAVGRRAYDTRAYGRMRAELCLTLIERSPEKSVSALNAQIEMGRELADFLEEQTPQLITSVIQLLASLIILFGFGFDLGLAGVISLTLMPACYAAFHNRFYRLNAVLNALAEEQVGVLQASDASRVAALFEHRRKSEVRLSDADSFLYGPVYLALFGLIIANLWSASALPNVTAGAIFAIISYSWEMVESGVQLPVTLQQWARLTEIQQRINR
ncbi:MAG: ABC transporter six-transmembrane domain-containing protein [Pseudomonadota bacterium]